MTNADWIKSRPELTAAAVIARAEAWYEKEHPRADTETAGLLAVLTKWLAAEHDDEGEARRTVTVVTTLYVTHVLRDLDADQVTGQVAQRLAESALQSARYGDSCLHEIARADNISIRGVQVFGLENDDPSGIVDDGTDTDAEAEAQA